MEPSNKLILYGKTTRFITLTDEWYDEGTEAYIVDDIIAGFDDGDFWGLFVGIRNGEQDEETCTGDEFIHLGYYSE